MARKKSNTKKKSSKVAKKSKTKYFVIPIIIVVVLAAAYLIFTSLTGAKDDAVGYVNGEPIYMNDVKHQISRLPATMQSTVDNKTALSQIIDKKLLLLEANKENIDVAQEMQRVLENNNLTEEQLTQILESQGLNVDEFKQELKILVFLNNTVFAGITVTDNEIKDFYDSNPNYFIQPETVVARHILILTSNRTDADAKAQIEKIKTEFEANESSFCDMARKFSEDPGSADNCGEYPAFSMNENFVQEFKEAAFKNKAGEASIAKTIFGYHLIWTIEKNPETMAELSEVKDKIELSILAQKQTEKFNNYVDELHKKYETVNCFETPDSSMCKGKVLAVTTTNNNSKGNNSLESFASCLTEKGVKMYGAYWCSHCKEQKDMFGSAVGKIAYVECAVPDDTRAQTQACKDANIKGYPTWEINGQQYPGVQSFETLSKLTGCKLAS